MAESPWFSDASARPWIGLDVGGANLKAADGHGHAASTPFELWKRPGDLAEALNALLEPFVTSRDVGVALTMTGELADCFESKADGVRAIVDATVSASEGATVRVATVDDRWLTPEDTLAEPLATAAANWRLGARLVASVFPRWCGLWIDVGSTTTDVIPFGDGRVTSDSRTDTDRLVGGELVYAGVGRTPVCAVVSDLPYRGAACPVMAEWFATTADAWLLLGQLPEDPSNRATADGREFTRGRSIERLARCVGADRDDFDEADAVAAASAVCRAQVGRLASLIRRIAPQRVVVSGGGDFVAIDAAVQAGVDPADSASAWAGTQAARAFPAHAAAVLAAREIA